MKAVALLVLAIILCACAPSQCKVALTTFDSAQVLYQQAQKSGVTAKIDKYAWTLGAAEAMVSMWCAEVPTPVDPIASK